MSMKVLTKIEVEECMCLFVSERKKRLVGILSSTTASLGGALS